MTRADTMADIAQRYVERKQFAGIEWHVETNGEVLTAGRTGVANVSTGAALPESPIYRLYSMTKPIVSVMALILIEQGKLRLMDPLSVYDPRFAQMRVLHTNGALVPADRPILVEDLITHRAGFTYEFITGCHIAPYYREAEIAGDGACSLDEMMGRLAQQPLAFQPGTQYRYSVCTDALAWVCECAAGQPINELLSTHLFQPLGMGETDYQVPADKLDRLLPIYGSADITALGGLDILPHDLTEADVSEMYPVDNLPNFRRGGHGLFSTMSDYARFARMLLTGKSESGEIVLSRKMIETMRMNRIPPEQLPLRIGANALPGYGWGLGVRVMIDPGKAYSLTSTGELGWAGAGTTYFWVDPLENTIGLVMSQYLGATQPLTDDMRAAAYQLLP